MASPAPSWRPAARPKYLTPRSRESGVIPLRGGEQRQLNELRRNARSDAQPIVARALASVSDQRLTAAFGNSGDKFGAEVRAGSAPVQAGELAFLVPPINAIAALVALAKARGEREIAGADGERETRTWRLIIGHINAIAELLALLE